MQEPLLRPDVPYPQRASHQDQQSDLVPASRLIHLYSFYLAALLYILAVSACYDMQIRFDRGIFDFYTENIFFIVAQVFLIFIFFFPVWGLCWLLIRFIIFLYKKVEIIHTLFAWDKDIIRTLSRMYVLIAFGLGMMMMIVKFFWDHHPHGISFILAVFLVFLLALYGHGPVLLYKISSAVRFRRFRQPGTSFAQFKNYVPFEEPSKER